MRALHLSLCATKSTTAGKNRVLIVRRQSSSPSYILYYAYIELLVIPDPSSGDDPGHLLFDEMGKEKREKERKKETLYSIGAAAAAGCDGYRIYILRGTNGRLHNKAPFLLRHI